MEWSDVLRLFALVGVAHGAWPGFQRMPLRTMHNGKGYYSQEDGTFRSFWGRRVKDPAGHLQEPRGLRCLVV